MKNVIIRCNKCGKIYTGHNLDDMIRKENLVKHGKGYICKDCPKNEYKTKKSTGFMDAKEDK